MTEQPELVFVTGTLCGTWPGDPDRIEISGRMGFPVIVMSPEDQKKDKQ